MSKTNNTRLIIYEDGDQSVDVRLDGVRETVWLTQRQMAEIFDTTSEHMVIHLKNIDSTTFWPASPGQADTGRWLR